MVCYWFFRSSSYPKSSMVTHARSITWHFGVSLYLMIFLFPIIFIHTEINKKWQKILQVKHDFLSGLEISKSYLKISFLRNTVWHFRAVRSKILLRLVNSCSARNNFQSLLWTSNLATMTVATSSVCSVVIFLVLKALLCRMRLQIFGLQLCAVHPSRCVMRLFDNHIDNITCLLFFKLCNFVLQPAKREFFLRGVNEFTTTSVAKCPKVATKTAYYTKLINVHGCNNFKRQ